MVRYRRSTTPGTSYFFTVNLRDRLQHYLVDHIEHLRAAFIQTKKIHPFDIVAIVVLPDHIHAIFQLPEGDNGYPQRWHSIKSHFTKALVKEGESLFKNDKGEYNLWQRRYWEHQIRDEIDMQRHIDYIHFNPVKHGHVEQVADWPNSSFHQYVESGVLPVVWAGGGSGSGDDRYGE